MNADLEGVNRLAEPLRAPVRHFADRLKELAAGHALSLGVIAAPAVDLNRHGIPSVVVFDTVDVHVLRRLAREGAGLGRQRIAAPLVFTPAEIEMSCDTFPLEFIEIQQRSVPIFGPDFFAPLKFHIPDVRLQCERELKGISIGIDHGLLTTGDDEQRLKKLSHRFRGTLLRTLAGVLWISEIREPRDAENSVAQIEVLCKRLLPGVRHTVVGNHHAGWRQFAELRADVKALEAFVDAL